MGALGDLGEDLPVGADVRGDRIALVGRGGWVRLLTRSGPVYWLDTEGISRGRRGHATLLWADVTAIDVSEPPRIVLRTSGRDGARVEGRTFVITAGLLAIGHDDLVALLHRARGAAAR